MNQETGVRSQGSAGAALSADASLLIPDSRHIPHSSKRAGSFPNRSNTGSLDPVAGQLILEGANFVHDTEIYIMRGALCSALLALILLAGCQDRKHGPRLAMRQEGGGTATSEFSRTGSPVKLDRVSPPPHVRSEATTKVPANFRYQGHSIDEWALALNDPDQDKVRAAAEALHVIGAPGRPYLIQGLEHPNPETRRLCLDYLTVSDVRVYGERGRDVLVKLCGDPDDFRIRARASLVLGELDKTIPARP
jgi:hypothetical protein